MQLLSGRILKPSMERLFVEKYTESLVVIPVSRFQSQANDKEQMTLDTFGRILNESFRQLDLFGASLKTSQDTLRLDSPKFTEAYEIWVTKLRQDCLQRRNVVRPIDENGCLSWPTSRVSDVEGGIVAAEATKSGFRNPNKHGSKLKEAVVEVQNWPTMAMGTHGRGATPVQSIVEDLKAGRTPKHQALLVDAVMVNWPSPTASASKGSSEASLIRKNGKSRADRLDYATECGQLDRDSPNTNGKNQELWRTPTEGEAIRNMSCATQTYLQDQLRSKGKLNPDWVEQLMGLQTGWTDLGSWVTE